MASGPMAHIRNGLSNLGQKIIRCIGCFTRQCPYYARNTGLMIPKVRQLIRNISVYTILIERGQIILSHGILRIRLIYPAMLTNFRKNVRSFSVFNENTWRSPSMKRQLARRCSHTRRSPRDNGKWENMSSK